MEDKRLCESNKCCGCGTCVSVCPTHAISMKNKLDTFSYPEIDEGLCIKCHKCYNSCPSTQENTVAWPMYGYAAVNKDSDDVALSSSGGAFSAIARTFIKAGGYVCGSEMQYGKYVGARHIIIKDESDIPKLQGSKYVQSDLNTVYIEIKDLLKAGELVLFSGTPCQVAGLKLYLGKKQDRLYTIDIVCHGVPSPELFASYIKLLENKHGKVKNFSFRDKSYGWGKFGSFIVESGQKVELPCEKSSYYSMFMSGHLQRESCYSCQFAKAERVSDMTIGDYWGIEKYQPELLEQIDVNKGCSAILVNTDKGKELIVKYGMGLRLFDSEPQYIIDGNSQLRHPAPKGRYRNMVYKTFVRGGGTSHLKVCS